MTVPQFKSFMHAFRGISRTFINERNFWFHVVAGCIVVVLAAFFRITGIEWMVLVITIALVLILELINTAIEYLLDLLKPRLHHHVLLVKDATAGAVLVAAVAALIIGCIIFIPHLQNLLN